MIVIIKAGTPQNQIDRLIRWLQSQGVQAHLFAGEYDTTLTLVGQTSRMNIELLAGLEIVQEVKWVSQPFQCCSREFRPQDTVISLPGSQVRIGGGSFCLIAGPCSVESPEQILEVAKAVQAAGAQILRGGAFKPRTSPYAFQGLGAQGIQMLVEAKRGNWASHHHRGDECQPAPPVLSRWTSCNLARETCTNSSTFCGRLAETPAKARAPEAGTLRHFDGAAHERRATSSLRGTQQATLRERGIRT